MSAYSFRLHLRQSLKLFFRLGLTTFRLSQFDAQLGHAVPLLRQVEGHVGHSLLRSVQLCSQFHLAVSCAADLGGQLRLALSVSLLGRLLSLLPVAVLLTAQRPLS